MRYLVILSGLFVCLLANSQPPETINTLTPPEGFGINDDVSAAYDSFAHVYRLNFQDGKTLYRRVYDTSFQLLDEYVVKRTSLLLSPKSLSTKATYIGPLIVPQGFFEVYGIENGVEIYQPDFLHKRDTQVARLKFDPFPQSGEQVISLFPGTDGFKIITYSKKLNAIHVYKWRPEDGVQHFIYRLPKTNLTRAEEKLYDKDCQIKLNTLWTTRFIPSGVNDVKEIPAASQLFYQDDRIYLLMPIPYSLGYFMIDIDLEKDTIRWHNFFVNTLQTNANWHPYISLKPVSTIFDSILVIQNSSHNKFEYWFFDINTRQPVRKFHVNVGDSLYHLVHSPLTQKGTYGSPEQEKEISKERAFMRKIGGAFSFMTVSRLEADSIVFTLCFLKRTAGIEGTMIALATGTMGAMANINMYLVTHRMNLFFVHSRFSRKTLDPANDTGTVMTIDHIIDKFAVKELGVASSFFVRRNYIMHIGVFDPGSRQYELHRFTNR